MQKGMDKKVQAGDQSKKLNHKGKKIDQGDNCCSTSDFGKLTGREGALDMKPKVKGQPKKGPFDALNGKKAGKSKSMPSSNEKELTKVKK